MYSVLKSALVPYDAMQMYRLVADVEAYPRFLPWCRSVRVLERNGAHVRATLELAKGPVHRSFTTVNRMLEGERIEMRLEEGPFRHLHGHWEFLPLGDEGSKVTLEMDFDFSSRLLAVTVGPVFHEIANRLVDAFLERAMQVYGRRP